MAGSCGGTLVKLMLALFNFVWLGIGSFVIYMGVQIFQMSDDIKDIVKSNLGTGSLILIIFGSAVVLIAAIGFVGACCESSLMLNLYGIILLVLLIFNISGLYFGYRYQDEFNEKLSEGIKNGIQNFQKDEKLAYALQKVQTMLHCCGWDGPGDYGWLGGDVPNSCCKETDYSMKDPIKTCKLASASLTGYSSGCKASPVVTSLTGNITYTAYALILIQLVVVLAACCLARDLNAHY